MSIKYIEEVINMKIIETKLYTFEELPEEAKEKAIEEIREWNDVDFWYWFDETIGSAVQNWLISQEYDYKPYIPSIDFKSCQWHFASYSCGHNDFKFKPFTLAISDIYAIYKKDMTERHKRIFELHIQNDYDVNVDSRSHNYEIDKYYYRTSKVINSYYDQFVEALNELEYDIYNAVNSDIEYHNSEDYLIECAEMNEIFFTENGKIYK